MRPEKGILLVTISREKAKNEEHASLLERLEYGNEGLVKLLKQLKARRTEVEVSCCRACDAVHKAGSTLLGCSAKLRRHLKNEIEITLSNFTNQSRPIVESGVAYMKLNCQQL